MERQIFVVTAHVVDSNGSFSVPSGYPKTFDSKNYGNDITKARQRAMGEFAECFGAMCKVDSRQLQTVMLMEANGMILDHKCLGKIADLPEQEQTNEAEE